MVYSGRVRLFVFFIMIRMRLDVYDLSKYAAVSKKMNVFIIPLFVLSASALCLHFLRANDF